MQARLRDPLLWAAATALLCVVSPVRADHRSAPAIDSYSAIGVNDVYMFRDPANCTGGPGCKLVVALSTQALADPLFGPSYHFQENALYRLNFTTRQDARPTASIDFVFGPFGNGPDCLAPHDACQTFRAVFPNKVVVEGFTTQGTFDATHQVPEMTTAGDIKIFAGPREDPFFFDLVGFNRSIAAGANKFTGVDAFLGKNVNAIVVEFPVGMVFPNICTGTISASGFTTPCGVWAVTYLGNFHTSDTVNLEAHPEALRQVDRMGNPAVNTLLIPAALKDSFNFGEPKDDAANFAGVILNQILALDKDFGTCQNGNTTSASACNPNVPLLASVAVPDTLKFALNFADGFPNGRQQADRTTDLLISLILQIPNFTDGTATKTYCSVFPFLGPPLQLSDAAPFKIIPQSCP